jgi:hypothetical protein
MFEQLIACSDTTPKSSYIIEREVMANTLYSLTDLFEATDAREEGKTPFPDTSNASPQQVSRFNVYNTHTRPPTLPLNLLQSPEAVRSPYALSMTNIKIKSHRRSLKSSEKKCPVQ